MIIISPKRSNQCTDIKTPEITAVQCSTSVSTTGIRLTHDIIMVAKKFIIHVEDLFSFA